MNTARISPVELRTSQQMRLQRLSTSGKFKGMSYREEAKQLVVPMTTPHSQSKKTGNNDFLVRDLQELLHEMLGDQ